MGSEHHPSIVKRWRSSPLWLLLPYGLGAALLFGFPLLLVVGLAWTDYDVLSPPMWSGSANLRSLAADRFFRLALRNSLLFAALSVPLRLLLTLGLALWLSPPQPGGAAARSFVVVPTVIPDVAYALIWLWILNPLAGPLNLLLGALGLPTPAWLAQGRTAFAALVLMTLFQIGEGFVVLLAARRGIASDYYAAATVDGATNWQQCRWITLPLLRPWLGLLAARDLLLTLQQTFAAAHLMTEGGPYYATYFIPQVVFDEAFDHFRFGRAAAMLLLVFGGLGLVLGLGFKLWLNGIADEP